MATETLQVIVTGTNLDVTPALRSHAEQRASKIAKYFSETSQTLVEVVLSVVREQQIAEVTVKSAGLIIRAESRTSDMYASIDASMDRVVKQIRRNKARLQRRAQSAPKLAGILINQIDNGEDEAAPQLVRTKRFAMKPMDVEEAVLQMDLLGHDFFVFRDATTEEVNVVYRRRDGNYGLIEPQ